MSKKEEFRKVETRFNDMFPDKTFSFITKDGVNYLSDDVCDILTKQAQQDLKTKILTIVWKVKEDRSSHKCERIIKKIKEV